MNKAPKKCKRWLRRLIWILILLLILAGIGYYAYTALKQEYNITYDSYTATTGSISNALSFSGNLSLIDSASYTAPANATVRKLYVSEGDPVSDGDKLLRLSNGTTIKAEFDGTVNALSVTEGDEVYAGDILIQIADFEHLRVAMRVDEYDINDVAVGQACTVTATATEKRFESEIASIDHISASGGNVAYYTATCDVTVDGGVYPGMQVSVSIPKEEANDVVVLSMNALSFDAQNSAFVYMEDESGELIEIPVEVGVSNGNYVQIISGLKDSDEVFVESQEEETASGLSGLLSGVFGGQQFNPRQSGRNRDGSGNMPGGFNGGGFSGANFGGSRSGQMGGGQP